MRSTGMAEAQKYNVLFENRTMSVIAKRPGNRKTRVMAFTDRFRLLTELMLQAATADVAGDVLIAGVFLLYWFAIPVETIIL